MKRFIVFFGLILCLFLFSGQAAAMDKAITIGGQSTYNIVNDSDPGVDGDISLASKDYVDQGKTINWTVGAEGNGTANSDTSGNTIIVTAQVQDNAGNNVEDNFHLYVWLSENATTGAATTNLPDGGGAAESGVVVGDGTQLVEVTDEVVLDVMTNSTGTATIEVFDDDAGNDWYLFGETDGSVSNSEVIDHAS